MKRQTPCDNGTCPYDAYDGNSCRNNCGVGVDEDSIEIEELDEFQIEPDDYTGNMPCDNTGFCSSSCSKYWSCHN